MNEINVLKKEIIELKDRIKYLENEEYDCISCIGDSFIINTYELNIYNQKRISNAYEHVKRSINEAIDSKEFIEEIENVIISMI